MNGLTVSRTELFILSIQFLSLFIAFELQLLRNWSVKWCYFLLYYLLVLFQSPPSLVLLNLELKIFMIRKLNILTASTLLVFLESNWTQQYCYDSFNSFNFCSY